MARDGRYEIALRRWPEEANTAICGTVPAWDSVLGNHRLPVGKAFPIVKARLSVGEFNGGKEVAQNDTVAVFNVSPKPGQTMLRGTFLDDQGKEICGAYYVSVRYLADGP